MAPAQSLGQEALTKKPSSPQPRKVGFHVRYILAPIRWPRLNISTPGKTLPRTEIPPHWDLPWGPKALNPMFSTAAGRRSGIRTSPSGSLSASGLGTPYFPQRRKGGPSGAGGLLLVRGESDVPRMWRRGGHGLCVWEGEDRGGRREERPARRHRTERPTVEL